jgi:hypothetical protein
VPTSARPTPPAPIVDVRELDAEDNFPETGLAHFVPESARPLPFVTPPPLPPVPPRPELDLVKSLEALPLPQPAPPMPYPPPGTSFRGSCKARNPATGIQCALLAGHTKLHCHGSTEFRFGAQPGASAFPRRDALEQAATGRPDSPFTT